MTAPGGKAGGAGVFLSPESPGFALPAGGCAAPRETIPTVRRANRTGLRNGARGTGVILLGARRRGGEEMWEDYNRRRERAGRAKHGGEEKRGKRGRGRTGRRGTIVRSCPVPHQACGTRLEWSQTAKAPCQIGFALF